MTLPSSGFHHDQIRIVPWIVLVVGHPPPRRGHMNVHF